jgi:hypothetical protein
MQPPQNERESMTGAQRRHAMGYSLTGSSRTGRRHETLLMNPYEFRLFVLLVRSRVTKQPFIIGAWEKRSQERRADNRLVAGR